MGGGGRIFVRPDHGLAALSAELGRALRFFLQPATDAESNYCGKHPAAFCRGRYENAAAHADQSLVALYPYRRAVAHDADCDTGKNHVLFCVVTPSYIPTSAPIAAANIAAFFFPNGRHFGMEAEQMADFPAPPQTVL